MIKTLIILSLLILPQSCSSTRNLLQPKTNILLTEKNTYAIEGSYTVQSVQKWIKEIEDKRKNLRKSKTLFLVIKSPGGSVYASNLLINYLRTLDNTKLIAHQAASAAFNTFQLAELPRIVHYGSYLMTHHILTAIPNYKDLEELEAIIKKLRTFSDDIATEVAEKLKMTTEDYDQLMSQDYNCLGTSCAKYKMYDYLSNIKCSQKFMNEKRTIVKRFSFMGIPVEQKVEVSKCPLM